MLMLSEYVKFLQSELDRLGDLPIGKKTDFETAYAPGDIQPQEPQDWILDGIDMYLKERMTGRKSFNPTGDRFDAMKQRKVMKCPTIKVYTV